jgi:hypothetical protein
VPPLAGYGLGWMSASDLHLCRVHFHFGASSGGTAVLAVYPGSGVVVAVLANLGHAKLPFRLLVNIARPFLPWQRPDIPIVAMALAFMVGALLWVNHRKSRRMAATKRLPLTANEL